MYDETSWFLAAQETIMTWALFGATIISVFSVPQNAHCTNLKRDLAIVVALTIVGLVLSALFAGACVNILKPDIYFVEKRNYGKKALLCLLLCLVVFHFELTIIHPQMSHRNCSQPNSFR